MSVQDWLSARRPEVPDALRLRMHSALLNEADEKADEADRLVAAAERVLDGVLGAGEMTRAHALDVLAADALATYAFEASAESGGLARCADRAFVRIAALGEPAE
jgi:hypothetical protein